MNIKSQIAAIVEWMSDEDKEQYEGRPSRKNNKTTPPLPAQANYSGMIRMRDRMEDDKKRREATKQSPAERRHRGRGKGRKTRG